MRYTEKLILNWEEYSFAAPGGWWTPWANTFMYLPMTSDFDDATWNNTMSNSGATIVDLSWVKCWYFNWHRLTCSESPVWDTNYTISVWVNITNSNWNNWIIWSNHSADYSWDQLIVNYNSSEFEYRWYRHYDEWKVKTSTMPTANTWQHICYSNWKIYLNWNDVTDTVWSWTMLAWYSYTIWQQNNWSNSYIWYMSELIVESVEWTEQEISDYFDQTKSLYGINN